ncbi:hypothetical protein [Thalassococcus sp. S3]|uniref:hypothetical protein n=1 Tax=Thalassococcus sp. S3 TaxID=2017482 RepID=UPI0013EED8F0|nr:hypothetical protein [Thalassococcus sp. S3]
MSVPPVTQKAPSDIPPEPQSEVPFNPIPRDRRLPKATDLPKTIDLGDLKVKPLPEGRGGAEITAPVTPSTDVTIGGKLGEPASVGVSQDAGPLGVTIKRDLSGPPNTRGEVEATLGDKEDVNLKGTVEINPSADNKVRGSATLTVPLGDNLSVEGSVKESADGKSASGEAVILYRK